MLGMIALVTCLFLDGPLGGTKEMRTVRLSLKALKPRLGIVHEGQQYIYQATEPWKPFTLTMPMELHSVVSVNDKVYDEEDF